MSHQLHCPECTTVVPPANINIQQTIAVCPNCGAVFNFADKVNSTQKIKRRKAKQPDYITKTETDSSVSLQMPLLTTSGYKWGSGIGAVAMFLFWLFVMGATLSDGDTAAAIVFSTLFLPFAVMLLTSFFVRQNITADTEKLEHSYHLGNVPIYKRAITAADVSDVTVEEMTGTRESVAQARYNVFADKYDGRQEMLINNFPEESAFYAQQVLSNYFTSEDDTLDTNRLADNVIDEQDEDLLQDDESLNSTTMQS